MDVNNLKKDCVYVLNKNEGIIAVFDKNDEDTIIDPVIEEIQNGEAKLTFQVPATSKKWKETYNPENLYLVDRKIFSANFSDCIEREREENGRDLITVVAYERQKLLERQYVRAWNSTTGFENIDEFMVVIVSGGDLDLYNDGAVVTTSYSKGSSGYALAGILANTGWTVGICDVEGTFDLETDFETVYDNLAEIQALWGGIFVFDSLNKVVHHRDETKYLPYSGFEAKYTKNLQSSKYIGDNKIITKLCPLGEGSLNIKEVNNGSIWLENYSYTMSVLEGIENNDAIYEQEQLKAWGERKLAELCKPRKELTLTTALLNNVKGYELEEIHLNDIVDVIDYEFTDQPSIQLRVIEYKHYLWNGADAELIIGDITLESTDIFKKAIQATNLINNGTLDTTKIVDYYKNGQSLKRTLRQIDQTIIDTTSELSKTDDEIKASVQQTETRVDNLNNVIVSQDIKISQLIVSVQGISSTVSNILDLTETITGYNGKIVIDNAMEGDLVGLSIHGYDGYDELTPDDTLVPSNTLIPTGETTLKVYTKNELSTKNTEWQLKEKDLRNDVQIYDDAYIGISYSQEDGLIADTSNYSGYAGLHFEYIECKPNTRYKLIIDDNIDITEYYGFVIASYGEDLFEILEDSQNVSIKSINFDSNVLSYENNQFVYDNTKHNYEIVTKSTDKYLVIRFYSSHPKGYYLYEVESNIGRAISPLTIVDNNYSYYLALKGNTNFRITGINYYGEDETILGNYYDYFNHDIVNGLSNIPLFFPINTKYITIELKEKIDGEFKTFTNFDLQAIKPMLEKVSTYKGETTYSEPPGTNTVRVDALRSYQYYKFSNSILGYATNNTEFEIEFVEHRGTYENTSIWGTQGENLFDFYTSTNGDYTKKEFKYNGETYQINTESDFLDVRTTASFKADTITGNYILTLSDILGHTESFTIPATTTFTSTKLISIMGNIATDRADVDVYNFKKWENNVLVANYIACFVKATGRKGFLELVNNRYSAWGSDYFGPGIIGVTYFIAPTTDFQNYNQQEYNFNIDHLRIMNISEGIDIASKDVHDYRLGRYNQNQWVEDNKCISNYTLLEVQSGQKIHFESELSFKQINFYDNNGIYLGDNESLFNLKFEEETFEGTVEVFSKIKYANFIMNKEETQSLDDAFEAANFQVIVTNIIYDEFTVIENNATLIRRIGVDGQGNKYVLTNPIYIDYGPIQIPLVDNYNYLEITPYTPTMILQYVKKNIYTDVYATKLELNSKIEQLANSITLLVKEKVGSDEIVAKINLAIEDEQGIIEILGNQISIKSDYFELTPTGQITATRGKIAGFDIWKSTGGGSYLTFDNEINDKYYRSGFSFFEDAVNFLFSGVQIDQSHPESMDFSNAPFRLLSDGKIEMQSTCGANKSKYAAKAGNYINLLDTTSQVETFIGSGLVDAYYVVAGDGGSKGSCMHATTLEHSYTCWWNGSNALCFYIDGTYVGQISDEKLKKDIRPIDDNVLDAIEEVEFKQFIADNRPNNISFGAIAQDIEKIFNKHELNWRDYLILDEVVYSSESKAMYFIIDYTQFLILKNACLERKLRGQENTIQDLANRIKKIEEGDK